MSPSAICHGFSAQKEASKGAKLIGCLEYSRVGFAFLQGIASRVSLETEA